MQLKRLICVAVSTTPDAAGSYYTYEYDMTPTGLATDYPQWGIWPTGYFQTLNGQTGSVSAVCAYDSTSLVNGGTAQQICVPLYFSAGQPNCSDTYLLPGDVDSTVKPPAGQDEFFVGSAGQGQADNGECYNGNGNCTNLYLYSMHPDWNNYGNTVVQGCGLSNPIPVQPYELFCPGLSGCVPQNSGVSLEALGRYSMRRFAYWNDQSGIFSKQHWFGNHVVKASAQQAGVQWYEFQAPSSKATISNVSLQQSGIFMPDGNYRWMGSIARDNFGDIALGYSESSTSIDPSIYLTGQMPGDTIGTMEQEVELLPLQQQMNLGPSPVSNWGDYSTMAIDPSDGCSFWYASEYYFNGDSNWHTWLTKFHFPMQCTPH